MRFFLSVSLGLGSLVVGCDEADNGVDECLSDENCPGGERCVEGFCVGEDVLREGDFDNDGILNGDEETLGTDPLDADSDGDGIRDGDEVGSQIADPPDADGDGIIDALDSAAVDDDGDGVPNQQDPCNDDPTCPEKPDETCNGVDDDFDGDVDEEWPELGEPCRQGQGPCERAGVWECALDGLGKSCSGGEGTPSPEVCNGIDDDCDGETDDGVLNPLGDCRPAMPDVCDGEDNDFDADTPDGAAHDWYGQACDTDIDRDLCAEGLWDCIDGAQTCVEEAGEIEEICDGLDNDCNPDTPDGADAAWVGLACDGADNDHCPEGAFVCRGGVRVCDDLSGDIRDVCDGEDNDCNADTPDGADEAWFGSQCDGDDADRCAEGHLVCDGQGGRICDDATGDNLELCDGLDNDCDPLTADGVDEGQVGSDCDGVDADLCTDGSFVCVNGRIACNDDDDDDRAEVCDGVDNNCDESVDEGFEVGVECAVGVGACARQGHRVCAEDGGSAVCDARPGEPGAELCGSGVDEDCDGQTDEGFDRLGEACAVGEGACERAGQWVCSGDGLSLVCDAVAGEPAVELCGTGVDEDCDGETDEAFEALGAPCNVGRGACRNDGRQVCDEARLALVCDAEPLEAGDEICGNGVDEDCNGVIDDGFPLLATPCGVGEGVCARRGVFVCTAAGDGVECDAVAGDAGLELCGNGMDDNCDGEVDEGFAGLGEACSAGAGACERAGQMVCTADGAGVVCDAVAGAAAGEICGNAVDEDCDGALDNGFDLGRACSVGVGACQRDGVEVCAAGGDRTECSVEPGAAGAELCGNGVDDNCDGEVDEGFEGLGLPCEEGVGACNAQGLVVCDAQRTGTTCDAVPGEPGAEVCDGIDNDCDPATVDGSGEPGIGEVCDGEDSDLCPEGVMVCDGGVLFCDDITGESPEVCNGEDDDCDGSVDEVFPVGEACQEGVGACQQDGVLACAADGQDTVCTAGGGDPIGELCGDGVDNDCDGAIDEGFERLGRDCSMGVGACERQGVYVCAADGGSTVCDAVPGQPEPDVCDGVDNDCDPLTADGSADDRVGVACDGPDADGCEEGARVCRGGALACTDETGDTAEVCDGVDNDCDGTADEPFDDLGAACLVGVGACETAGSRVCNAAGDGTVCDAQPGEPGAELCDGIDNDCDGDPTDDGAGEPTLGDACDGADADDCAEGAVVCLGGALGCSDQTGDIVEVCDGEDNDCDGTADEPFADLGEACQVGVGECVRDGARVCAADGSATVCSATPGPAGLELCDGLDNDCDGDPTDDGVDEATFGSPCDGPDADACDEGAVVCVAGGLTCDDDTGDIAEICDGVDNDCDGTIDDGFPTLGDDCSVGTGTCQRGGSVVCTADGLGVVCDAVPGAAGPELCDGLDNDCDGDLGDDGVNEATFGDPCDGADADACAEGTVICADGGLSCDDLTGDDLEVCDGADNNCDGAIDEGFDVGDACSEGQGECRADGVRVCTADGQGTRCNAVGGDPVGELCGDGVDNDCDGAIDEGYPVGDPCQVGVGECTAAGLLRCTADGGGTVCDVAPGQPGPELCDGLDNDCDGSVADDGADADTLGDRCDGGDADACMEGNIVCADAALTCDDRTGDSVEVCDGVDNDCDGDIDDGYVGLGDGCTDGLGECRAAGTMVCSADGQRVECDAVAGAVGPELCNGLDDDCDGRLDDDGADEDTLGDRCDGPDADLCLEGRIACAGGALGCDDATGDTADICDGVDNDCDGTADEAFPTLGDACAVGVGECRVGGTIVCTADGAGVECDAVPGQPGPELCDGLDNDCDPATPDGQDEDWLDGRCDGADADLCEEGVFECRGGAQACTDATGDDVEVCDGVDNDCDGGIDEAFDGLGVACQVGVGECQREGEGVCSADGQRVECSVAPGPSGPELCDGLDNDCDGRLDDDGVDEGWIDQACDGPDSDRCPEGTFECQAGRQACTDATGDSVEVCDGVDNDCDGSADEPFDDLGNACSVGVGECRNDGTRVCRADGAGTECSVQAGQPGPELCDGLDNDCDPQTADGADERWNDQSCDGADADLCADGQFVCRGGQQVCTDGPVDAVEVCDGEDNDCDGSTDEGFPTLGDACSNGIGECSRPGTMVCAAGGGGVVCDAVPGLPGPELCDGLDNDCDPATADGQDEATRGDACDGPDADECMEGVVACQGAVLTCTDATGDTAELCDGVDNDCDGGIDEGYAGLGADCQAGIGECARGGRGVCNAAGDGVLCDAVAGLPGPELCDGLDNDCDNDSSDDGADEDWEGQGCDGPDSDRCMEGVFRCLNVQQVCTDVSGDSVEVCDGVDNDCIGGIDDPFDDLGNACSNGLGECARPGVMVCSGDQQGTVCDAVPGQPGPELCDLLDNDCDPQTPDGADEIGFGLACDGVDSDLCTEGRNVCESGAYFCDDVSDDSIDVCDGIDNDCDDSTQDGSAENGWGDACDGPDSDACLEGSLVCTEGPNGFGLSCDDETGDDVELCDGADNDCDQAIDEDFDALGGVCSEGVGGCARNGIIVCTANQLGVECDAVPGDPEPEVCDLVDNDCDPRTPDGNDEIGFGQACDGGDRDFCPEGTNVCRAGVYACSDQTGDNPDPCDGFDNDCDPSSPDGSSDDGFGSLCDGADSDLCMEGTVECVEGRAGWALACGDRTGDSLELCDGQDNDCNGQTPDGQDEPTRGDLCDGADADLCNEGRIFCQNGGLACSDPNSVTPDMCNGQDEDCNPNTPDGAHEPNLGQACDGGDTDQCPEGRHVCQGGEFFCDDFTGDNVELCDGVDNDCILDTSDGSEDPRVNVDCDGPDQDLCLGGNSVCQNGGVVCVDPGEDVEICNNADDDCDNAVDEGNPGGGDACLTGQPGICSAGTTLCTPNGLGCVRDNEPGRDDNCNGVDEDCDNESDEHWVAPGCNTGLGGSCEAGSRECVNGGTRCVSLNPRPEVCDGLDNDCDGFADNGLCCPSNDDLRYAGSVTLLSASPVQPAGDGRGAWAILDYVPSGQFTDLRAYKRDSGIVHTVHSGQGLSGNEGGGFGAATALAYTTAEDVDNGGLLPIYAAAYVVEVGAAAARRVVHLRGMAGENNVAWTSVDSTQVAPAGSSDPDVASDTDGMVWVVWRSTTQDAPGVYLGEYRITYALGGPNEEVVGFELLRSRRVDSGGVQARSPQLALIPAGRDEPSVGVVWVEGEQGSGGLRFRSFSRNTFQPDMAVRTISGPGVNGNNATCDAPDIAYAADGGGEHFAITCFGNDANGAAHLWYTPIRRGGGGVAFEQLTDAQNVLASTSRIGWMSTNRATYVVFSDNGQIPGQYLVRIDDRRPAAPVRTDAQNVPGWPAVHIDDSTLFIPHHRGQRAVEGWIYQRSCQ